jgi:hypothetical protein
MCVCVCLYVRVCMEMSFNVQKAHSGVSVPKLQLTTTLHVTRDGFKYLCARDGSVHNSFDMNVTYGTLSAWGGRADIIYCTMQRMPGRGGRSTYGTFSLINSLLHQIRVFTINKFCFVYLQRSSEGRLELEFWEFIFAYRNVSRF